MCAKVAVTSANASPGGIPKRLEGRPEWGERVAAGVR